MLLLMLRSCCTFLPQVHRLLFSGCVVLRFMDYDDVYDDFKLEEVEDYLATGKEKDDEEEKEEVVVKKEPARPCSE
jgi:hypothetical protein